MMHDSPDAYDAICEKWCAQRSASPVNRCVAEFAQSIARGGQVLDIGCGGGDPIDRYLSGQGLQVTGIDRSASMIEKARALCLPGARFIVADVLEFAPESACDAVIAFDSLWHVPHAKQRSLYARLSAWLKPGGGLLFTHGKAGGEIHGEMFGQTFYYSALDVGEVRALLEDAGLTIERCEVDYREATTGERDLLVVARKAAR